MQKAQKYVLLVWGNEQFEDANFHFHSLCCWLIFFVNYKQNFNIPELFWFQFIAYILKSWNTV